MRNLMNFAKKKKCVSSGGWNSSVAAATGGEAAHDPEGRPVHVADEPLPALHKGAVRRQRRLALRERGVVRQARADGVRAAPQVIGGAGHGSHHALAVHVVPPVVERHDVVTLRNLFFAVKAVHPD